MKENTNTTPEIANTQESGAFGAPDDALTVAKPYKQTKSACRYWAQIDKGICQNDLQSAAHALEKVLKKCGEKGAHATFRNSLRDSKSTANEAAFRLIANLLVQVAEMHDQAKKEHVEYLRRELESYEAQATQTPST